MENCDEYIFYDDLVREQRKSSKSQTSQKPRAPKPKDKEAKQGADEVGSKEEVLDIILDTVDSLFRERDENIWASHIKQVIKRKKPQFSETFYGYRSFNEVVEDAATRGLLDVQKDEKSGGYVIIGFGDKA